MFSEEYPSLWDAGDGAGNVPKVSNLGNQIARLPAERLDLF
jgi:hypothetical protein